MSKPKYSIIIPHFNIPKLLRRCLDSIPSRDDIQVIVVDDCSSSEVVDELKNQLAPQYGRVEFFYQEENRGGGRCRNVGLKYAEGEWLLFADADDFFTDHLSELLDESYDDKNDIIYFPVDCVLSDNPNVRSNERQINSLRIEKYCESGDDKLLRYLYSEPWGKLIKKSLVDQYQIQFSETKVCNDYYFSAITGFHASNIKAVNVPLYVVTVRKNSVSSKTETALKIKDRIDVTVAVQSYLQAHGYKLEEQYKVEKLDLRMIALFKKSFFMWVKELFLIHQSGLSSLSVVKGMLKTFIHNRIKS